MDEKEMQMDLEAGISPRDSASKTTSEMGNEKDIEASKVGLIGEKSTGTKATSLKSRSSSSNVPQAHGAADNQLYSLHPIQSTHTNHISLSEVQPVNIAIRSLGCSVNLHPRNLYTLDGIKNVLLPGKGPNAGVVKWRSLLEDVSADLSAGSLTAIIGGSGSGKTTMLNLLSDRMAGPLLRTSGTVTFNGGGLEGVRSAYVMQQDILLPTLTVRETLQYSADLRLPPPTTAEERKRVVEEVILELGLKECADTRIGTHVHKGCSGGEKRRTSIGVQLLSNPSVLFLDEPTTGLDATSAYQLVRTLKMLAGKGRTVVTTIHQPRSEIYGIFDNLVILTKGAPVYSGSSQACLPYFEAIGFPLPPFTNPAEHLIDVAAIDNRTAELEAESQAKVQRLKESWHQQSLQKWGDEHVTGGQINLTTQVKETRKEARSTFNRQVRVLTNRTYLVTIRDPMGMVACITEALIMGTITGWIFYQLDESQSGIRSRQGALYTAAGLQGYLIMMYETFRLSMDIQLFDREHGEGVVNVIPFLLSRRLARILTEDIPTPFIFSTIYYFMSGFRADAVQYFTFFAVVLLTQYISVAFAALSIGFSRSFAGASLIGNLAFTVQSMACGFFIQSNTIPVYVRWLKYTAFVYYAFGALCANEFVGHFYACPASPSTPDNPACVQYTGAFIMHALGLPENWIWRPIIILLAFAIAFYVVAGLAMRFIPLTMTVARARTADTDFSAGKEMMVRSKEEVRTVDIGLDQFSLDLDKRSIIGKKLPRKTILQPVQANFEAGKLNVIMGPSGSGKTSLLNAMALRLFDRLGTTYIRHGTLTFNGSVPSPSVIRSVCSYVCQDDDALLPSLTVRETLRFSAGLRLPAHMSTAEKNARAETILLKMGLKDCADNLIGSELIKGISGGEKRRVSIAVQILTDPRVLLLDEPTSGLDAFTASSIMDVLRGLALEGRTLILTIHQSRSDLFQHFGNVLLLARGGAPCYAGLGAAMLPHFEQLGYPCPTSTNPADFALDLITVDLQARQKEEASRQRVQTLISTWQTTHAEKPHVASQLSTPAELGLLVRSPPPLRTALPLLLHRSLLNIRRQPPLLIARTMQVLGLGIILALFFSPLAHDYYSIQNRVGVIQQFCSLYFVGMLQNVAVYPAEKDVFYREADDNAYGVEAFLGQYTILEVPFEVISCLVFAVLVDIAGGLPRTPTVFFVVFFNCFCIVSCGESLGIMFNTLFAHTGFALNLTSVLLSISLCMSGLLSIHMPAFLEGINYLSPVRYAIANLAPYTLRGVELTCEPGQRIPGSERCLVESGEQVLELFGFAGSNMGLNLLGVGIATVVYRLIAYALLKAVRTHWREVGGRLRAGMGKKAAM